VFIPISLITGIILIMKRVTGLGGVFYKAKDKQALLAWYKKHLQIAAEDWGAIFSPKDFIATHPHAYQVWSLFAKDTDHFAPSTSSFMLNFTVEDLSALLPILKAEGVELMDKFEESEFGKFGWILDLEGNKIELWEPPKK
jgi:predicted enzyme related to lactoylglutathione lyase